MSGIPFLFALGAAIACCGDVNTNAAPEHEAILQMAAMGASPATSMLSQYRVKNGLGPVVHDTRLQRVAQAQADAMARADQLSHDVAGSLPSRLSAHGAPYRTCAENVSVGYSSVEQAFVGWQRSSAHNANLLNPSIRKMGIAVAAGPSGARHKKYWAIVMTD